MVTFGEDNELRWLMNIFLTHWKSPFMLWRRDTCLWGRYLRNGHLLGAGPLRGCDLALDLLSVRIATMRLGPQFGT